MVQEWKLNVDNFTLLDRLKICKFFLSKKNRWTQGKYVKEYEKVWAEYTGCKYAVMFSSGSTANSSIAQYVKRKTEEMICGGSTILVPSVTWQTSVTPWIKAGFQVKFLDITYEDFGMSAKELGLYLEKNSKKVAYVWLTSLIGFNPDIKGLTEQCRKYKVKYGLDNCENPFGEVLSMAEDGDLTFKTHICKIATSSISTYFGHHTTSTEGGFVLTDDEREYEFHLMNRSHGMTRSLTEYNIDNKLYQNNLVDPSFDFFCMGSNYRATDIEAFIGLLDFKRIEDYIETRRDLYSHFAGKIDHEKFILPKFDTSNLNVPFCLPIIFKENNKELILKAKFFCDKNKIEHRQIIGGNMLRQRPYLSPLPEGKEWENYPVAEHLHNYGFYVGLNQKVEKSMITNLTEYLNNL
jgi:CDP-6-deoxy-D-xylo-4-hexulose-3-dehydrase